MDGSKGEAECRYAQVNLRVDSSNLEEIDKFDLYIYLYTSACGSVKKVSFERYNNGKKYLVVAKS